MKAQYYAVRWGEEAKEKDLKAAAKLPYMGLSEAEFERFSDACKRTYQAIGRDLADARGGEPAPRDEIIEVVLDANHVRNFGETFGARDNWPQFYDQVIRPWLDKYYGSKPFMKLMQKVFPFSEYE